MFKWLADRKEAKRLRVLDDEYNRKLASPNPWFEEILNVDPSLPIPERYRWNAAFISKLEAGGVPGNSDVEFIENWLNAQESAKRSKILEEEAALRSRILQEDIENKINSTTPWFEIIPNSENAQPTHERYRWNAAFIASIKSEGIDGKNDVEIVENWLIEQERGRRSKVLSDERDSRRSSSEPWVEVIGEEMDSDNNVKLSLDWNKPFINVLKRNGFTGASEEEMIQRWLMSLHTEILAGESEYDG